ncbi:calmodulin-like 3 [Dissophora globulifera]|uniref:Calmodulin-like 3 n=1 Tax=Dissophora globulifera TaxID=979702 RepID=A0A9P6RPG8_9FUNG|nr:calmodulin-like 3 [Dissophora globulifera]KAG0323734.1 calmodulin-like 3 [Dissophora globulifera]
MPSTSFSESQLVDIKSQFNAMDKDGDGFITEVEFTDSIHKAKRNPEDYDLEEFFSKADKNKDGKISFTEFVEACSALGLGQANSGKRSPREVDDAFNTFDIDGDGYITKDELRKAMKHQGEDLSEEEINQMMREADKNGDEKISREEFAMMM